MIYIVIPVFNRWHFTQACLDCLRAQTFTNFKIIVVNDGSTDETAEQLKRNYPEVIVLQGDGNLWWTASINLGIDYALKNGGTHVLSLNNDTLPEQDYLEQLIKANRQYPDTLIGSTGINKETNAINYCGEKIDWLLDRGIRACNRHNIKNDIVEVSYFPGRGLLIPDSVFKTIGKFDQETFPHYMADFDFTLRAKSAGFPVYCSLKARLVTYPEASGANQLIAKKSLKNYKEHLFGIKGAANLKYYYTYVFRHCPWYYLPVSLTIGTLKRLGVYWLK